MTKIRSNTFPKEWCASRMLGKIYYPDMLGVNRYQRHPRSLSQIDLGYANMAIFF